MPAYKYTLKDGKTTRWRAKFYVTDWTGAKKQICKRGFKTQREAKEFEHSFLDQQNNTSDILFSSLVENYLEDMSHRLKPTTMENKRFIINGKQLLGRNFCQRIEARTGTSGKNNPFHQILLYFSAIIAVFLHSSVLYHTIAHNSIKVF